MGLVGVPWIAKSLADQGHQVILNIGGSVNPGTERFVRSNVDAALQAKSGAGTFGIVTFPSRGDWAYAPGMFRELGGYVRNADFITLHSLYSFPVLAGYLFAKWLRKPYALFPHGVLAPVQRQISAPKKRMYDWLIARRILNGASVLLYSAPGERDEASALNLYPPTAIVPHGLDVETFANLPPRGAFRARYLQGHTGPLILYLSRLNAKKGVDLLARAFALVLARFPDACLALVGSCDPPPFEAQVREWLRECGIADRTVMPGLLPEPEKLQAFADADVFVLPSQSENFGFAMFEAMASGVPVVVSQTLDYAPEVVRYGAGLAIPRQDSEFAAAILSLLEDEQYRRCLGDNGKELAKSYGWQSCAEQLERTLHNILSGRPL